MKAPKYHDPFYKTFVLLKSYDILYDYQNHSEEKLKNKIESIEHKEIANLLFAMFSMEKEKEKIKRKLSTKVDSLFKNEKEEIKRSLTLLEKNDDIILKAPLHLNPSICFWDSNYAFSPIIYDYDDQYNKSKIDFALKEVSYALIPKIVPIGSLYIDEYPLMGASKFIHSLRRIDSSFTGYELLSMKNSEHDEEAREKIVSSIKYFLINRLINSGSRKTKE